MFFYSLIHVVLTPHQGDISLPEIEIITENHNQEGWVKEHSLRDTSTKQFLHLLGLRSISEAEPKRKFWHSLEIVPWHNVKCVPIKSQEYDCLNMGWVNTITINTPQWMSEMPCLNHTQRTTWTKGIVESGRNSLPLGRRYYWLFSTKGSTLKHAYK